MPSYGTGSSARSIAAEPVDESEDLLTALADGLLDEHPPPLHHPVVTAGPAQPKASGRGPIQKGGDVYARLPAPSVTGPATFGRRVHGDPGVVARGSRPDSALEPHSGLRVKNPKFPAIVLAERLTNLCYIKLGQLSARATSVDGPWATVAVLAEKLPLRESATGKSYSLWRLSDLGATDKQVSVFLFDDAHASHWRLPQGTLLALFNAKVRVEDGKPPSLTATAHEQVVELGTAADFGYCQANRKACIQRPRHRRLAQDGERCRNAVNTAECRFCEFHVALEFRKLQPSRGGFLDSMLSTAFSRRPTQAKNQEGRKATTAMPKARAKPLHSTDLKRVAAGGFGRHGGLGSKYLATAAAVAESSERGGGTAGMADARSAAVGDATAEAVRKRKAAYGIPPRPSSAAQGRRSSAATAKPTGSAQPPAEETPPTAAKRHKGCSQGGMLAPAEGTRFGDTPAAVLGEHDAAEAAQQAEGSRQAAIHAAPGSLSDDEGDMLMLEEEELDFAARSQPADAHRHAVQVVKRLGGLPAPDPKTGRAKPAPVPSRKPAAGTSTSRRNNSTARADLNGVRQGAAAASRLAMTALPRSGTLAPQRADASRSRLESKLGMSGGGKQARPAHGGACRGGAQVAGLSGFAAAVGATANMTQVIESRYKHLVEDAENEELDKTLDMLERKEGMAAKMESITSMRVAAWQCRKCGYLAEHPAKGCRPAGHALTRIPAAVKRWWTCRNCSNHFATVGVRYPAARCSKCQHPEALFEKASMLRKQKGPEMQKFAERARMQARGTEHGKFLGA